MKKINTTKNFSNSHHSLELARIGEHFLKCIDNFCETRSVSYHVNDGDDNQYWDVRRNIRDTEAQNTSFIRDFIVGGNVDQHLRDVYDEQRNGFRAC